MSMIKTALKIGAGLVIGFILLCVLIVAVAPDTPASSESTVPAPKVSSQDAAWISQSARDGKIVVDLVTETVEYMTSGDIEIETVVYKTNSIYTTTDSALEISRSMNVSSDMSSAKQDYENALIGYGNFATCTNHMIVETVDGDMLAANDYGDQGRNWIDKANDAYLSYKEKTA